MLRPPTSRRPLASHPPLRWPIGAGYYGRADLRLLSLGGESGRGKATINPYPVRRARGEAHAEDAYLIVTRRARGSSRLPRGVCTCRAGPRPPPICPRSFCGTASAGSPRTRQDRFPTGRRRAPARGVSSMRCPHGSPRARRDHPGRRSGSAPRPTPIGTSRQVAKWAKTRGTSVRRARGA